MKTKLQQKNKEEFKETELGLLPKDWDVIKFGQEFKIKYGKSNPKKSGKIPVIGSSGIYAWTDEPLTKNDVLIIGRKGNAGEIHLFLEPSYPSDTTFYIELTNPNIDKKFLFYFMKSRKMSGEHAKTTVPSIQRPDLEKFEIPIPPLPEQERIAYVLSIVQDAKAKTQNLINSLKELKKSTMKHLFTYGAVSFEDKDKVKLKDTEIGMMPKDWDVIRLEKIIEKTEQKDMRKTNIEFKYVDVSGIDNNLFKIINHSLFNGEGAPSRAKKIVKCKDVIIATVRPTLKRIAIINEDFNNEVCSTAFCILRSKTEKLNSLYLFYSIQRDNFIEELGRIQRGASYPAVTDSDIKHQKILLPSLPEQQQIAHILSCIDEKIEVEERRVSAFEQLFKSLLHNLMSGKKRVVNLKMQEVKNG